MIGWNRRSVQPLIMVHKHECFKYYYDYLVNKGQGHVSFSSCVGRKHQIPFELTGSTEETQIWNVFNCRLSNDSSVNGARESQSCCVTLNTALLVGVERRFKF